MMWLRNKLFGTRWVIVGDEVYEVGKCESGWVGFKWPRIKSGLFYINLDGTGTLDGRAITWKPYYGW